MEVLEVWKSRFGVQHCLGKQLVGLRVVRRLSHCFCQRHAMSIEKLLRPAIAATGLCVGVGRCAGCLMLGREKYDDELVREYSCFRAHDESDTYVEVIHRPLDSFQQSLISRA